MWEHKGGKGLWENWVNSETGESSISTHEPKLIWKSCKKDDHYFEWHDIPKRIIQCKKCKMQKHLVIGMQALKDGKIVSLV